MKSFFGAKNCSQEPAPRDQALANQGSIASNSEGKCYYPAASTIAEAIKLGREEFAAEMKRQEQRKQAIDLLTAARTAIRDFVKQQDTDDTKPLWEIMQAARMLPEVVAYAAQPGMTDPQRIGYASIDTIDSLIRGVVREYVQDTSLESLEAARQHIRDKGNFDGTSLNKNY